MMGNSKKLLLILTCRQRRWVTPRRDEAPWRLRWLDQPTNRPKGKFDPCGRPAGIIRLGILFGFTPADQVRYHSAFERREYFVWSACERLQNRTRAWHRKRRVHQALRAYGAGKLTTHEAIGMARCRDYAELLVRLGDTDCRCRGSRRP
jgi:hypothetical protein